MTEPEKKLLFSILNILAKTSYDSLIEIRELKGAKETEIEELKTYKEILDNLISEFFEK